jgi:hypothetical protein
MPSLSRSVKCSWTPNSIAISFITSATNIIIKEGKKDESIPYALGSAKELYGYSSNLLSCSCTGHTGGAEDDTMAEESAKVTYEVIVYQIKGN